jgi:hypothetical protein
VSTVLDKGAGASVRMLLSCNVMAVRGVVLAVGKAGWSGIHCAGGTVSALSSTWGQFGPDNLTTVAVANTPTDLIRGRKGPTKTVQPLPIFCFSGSFIIRNDHRCVCWSCLYLLFRCRSVDGDLGGWGLEARRLFVCGLVSSGFASSSTVGAIGW